MPANLLTERAIVKARPKEAEYLLNDGNGLSLRVLTSGTKTWLLRIMRNKREIKRSLGRYPEVGLAEARKQALAFRQDLALGKDPNISTEKDPSHLDEIFDRWYKDYVLKNRTNEDNNRALKSRYETYVSPWIGKSMPDQLTAGAVLKVLDKAVKTGRLRQANLTLSELRQMFRYALVREWVSVDPTFGIAKKDVGGQEEPADRTLSVTELRHLKRILTQPRAGSKAGFQRTLPLRTEVAVWLALSTMARSVEIASVRSSDVDLKAGLWTVPKEVSKNKTDHIIHLNEMAKQCFGILLSIKPEGYLFPGRGPRKDGHIQEKAFTRELTDRQGREKPLKGRRNSTELVLPGGPWTMHDLRRTGATLLGEMDFDEKLIDLCLNHKEVRKVRKTYQKQQRLAARKRAFEALGTKLEEILGGLGWLPTPSPRQLASRQR